MLSHSIIQRKLYTYSLTPRYRWLGCGGGGGSGGGSGECGGGGDVDGGGGGGGGSGGSCGGGGCSCSGGGCSTRSRVEAPIITHTCHSVCVYIAYISEPLSGHIEGQEDQFPHFDHIPFGLFNSDLYITFIYIYIY